MQGFFVALLSQEAIVSQQLEAIHVELKYCEACGALWLRPRNSQAPYCRRCEKLMAELARAHHAKPAEEKAS